MTVTLKPKFPMCPMCVLNQDFLTTTYSGDGVWLQTCDNTANHPGHKPHLWQETPDGHVDEYPYGVTEEWGVYDDLLKCFVEDEPYMEHGVIEYRYKELNPWRYAFLIDRYGHIARDHKKRYTATAFLGSALGWLLRHGDLQHQWGPATGFFSYNGRISYWALASAVSNRSVMSWETFAADHGLKPDEWNLV